MKNGTVTWHKHGKESVNKSEKARRKTQSCEIERI